MSQLDNASDDFDISDYDIVLNRSRYEDANDTQEPQTTQYSRGKGKGMKKQKINDDEDETESDEDVDDMLNNMLNKPFVSHLFGYYKVSVLNLHS